MRINSYIIIPVLPLYASVITPGITDYWHIPKADLISVGNFFFTLVCEVMWCSVQCPALCLIL